jgi:hypothetical protein
VADRACAAIGLMPQKMKTSDKTRLTVKHDFMISRKNIIQKNAALINPLIIARQAIVCGSQRDNLLNDSVKSSESWDLLCSVLEKQKAASFILFPRLAQGLQNDQKDSMMPK